MRKFYKFDYALDTQLPERKTAKSAGYDFYLSEDLVIPPNTLQMAKSNTAVKMQEDDVLLLFARSSLCKRGLILMNGVGVVDADYDGEIMFPLLNLSHETVLLSKGERVAQGVFTKYTTCGDIVNTVRTGGFGSTK